MSIKIDFVIPWVDGNDPVWQEEFQKFTPSNPALNSKDRYRDWENLHFLFRGFEQFTPWVNKIYFITYGHIPEWLNQKHPKLTIVKHSDFLKPENLPLFNINPIEINLHKIKNLSEYFVYFNDDIFLLKPFTQANFFKNNLPLDFAISNIMHEGMIAHIVLNDIDIINKNFNRHIGKSFTKRQIILSNWNKWFNFKYGRHNIQTLLLLYWKTFTGFVNHHQAQPFLKSTFETLWIVESMLLEEVSKSKFRDHKDVNQYLFRYWQLVSGRFEPMSFKTAFIKRKYKELRTIEDTQTIITDLRSRQYEMYCINDAITKSRFTQATMSDEDYHFSKTAIIEVLNEILPHKSAFEL